MSTRESDYLRRQRTSSGAVSPAARLLTLIQILRRHGSVEFVYEAGSCGYNEQRQLATMGMTCRFCASFLTHAN
jgi:hypothetical protein